MPKEWVVYHRGFRWVGKRPARWLPKGWSRFEVLTRCHRVVMSACRWKGICVVELWTRAVGPGAGRARLKWRKEWPDMKPVRKADRASVKHLAALESKYFHDLLSLVEHVAVMQYDDQSPREPGWFTVRTTGAAWQVTVKDPDSASSFTAVGKSLDEALETAALLLGTEEAPWEPDAYLAASAARKRKK